MKIIIGKTSGFCGGVQNAVIKTEKELNNNKSDIYCLGEIVHNKQVIENLKRQYETNLLIPVYHKIGRSTVHKRKGSNRTILLLAY